MGKQKFYAHSYIRLMAHHRAVDSIGQTGVLLCTFVAMQEDAIRYARAVTFWNNDLQAQVGIKRWESFNKARDAAVREGWLIFTNQGNRKPGLYETAIPEGCELPPNSEAPTNDYDTGYKAGYMDGCNTYAIGYITSDMTSDDASDIYGYNDRYPSYLNLDLSLNLARIEECAQERVDEGESENPFTSEAIEAAQQPSEQPKSDDEAWRYEIGRQPWAQTIKGAGGKIGPGNWRQWETLWKDHGLDRVISAIKATKPADRWPDHVEQSITTHKTDDGWGKVHVVDNTKLENNR